jgi:cysteine-rich repeat protein
MNPKHLGAWFVLASAAFLVGSGLGVTGCGSSDDSSGLGGKKGTGGTDGGTTGGAGGVSGGGQGGAAGSGGQTCGNGKVEGKEECDDGNLAGGDTCDNTCSFTCVAGDPNRDHCDDGNPCNGVETCGADHGCHAGTPLQDGESCGTNLVCVNGNCISASCGDGQTQTGEECDDGNVDDTDGCTKLCKFTCLSSDPTRDCTATGDECAGTNKCDDIKHTCTGGTPLADNAPCKSNTGYCAGGVCTTAQCGNSKPEPGEECDDGNTVDTDGCTKLCKFTCTSATQCSDNNSCTTDTCTAQHTCANPPDATKNGAACTGASGAGTCNNGACVPASCGDGTVQGSEQCDLGSAVNGTAGSGCTKSCTFQCNTDADCTDNNACTGTETCVSASGGKGKACAAGTPLNKGDVCLASPRSICDANGGQCKLSVCGDAIVDTGGGEQCEPPNTATCDAQCKTIATAVCGNGKIEGTEQCDDGNTLNLDGCDSKCKYEMILRMIDADIMGGASPSWCTPTKNQLGNVALTSTARGQLNTSLSDGINAGTTNVLVQSLGLDDLTGVSDPALELGIMTGVLDPAKGSWPATGNPIDWWFKVDPAGVDATGLPTGKLTGGSLAAKLLVAGPSDVNMTLVLGGVPALLQMRDARIRGVTSGTPNVPAPPPSALAPGLTVFPEFTANQTGQGLCGNITVDSLSKIPVPEALTTGTSACGACSGSKKYTYCGANQPVGANCNSLLDALVGGCKVLACLVTAINATQPDVPKPGGSLTPLSNQGPLNKIPTAQTSGNMDAYSAYLSFLARRAHITGKQ